MMHTIIFRLSDGTEIRVQIPGSPDMKVRNWWVTDGPTGARVVDVCLHTYEPVSSSTS